MKKTENLYEIPTEARKFPLGPTLLLCALVLVQIACVLSFFFYQPQPQDVIDEYTVYASPQTDGSLNIRYTFTWTALDPDEPLTWVEIGMANEYFTVEQSWSPNIYRVERYVDGEGYCSARVYFRRDYTAGETLTFSFTVNQKRILATNGPEIFYELVPGWFNRTPITHYTFYFERYGDIEGFNGDGQDEKWLKWEGALAPGGFVRMRVNYGSYPAPAVYYAPFDESGCYNDLAGDKTTVSVMALLAIAFALMIEIGIIDAYVSYHRGRGFLRGYGHHVHVHGHINPHYHREWKKHNARGGGGGGGRGCACACACACAGGGRAGCSQKDTYAKKNKENA